MKVLGNRQLVFGLGFQGAVAWSVDLDSFTASVGPYVQVIQRAEVVFAIEVSLQVQQAVTRLPKVQLRGLSREQVRMVGLDATPGSLAPDVVSRIFVGHKQIPVRANEARNPLEFPGRASVVIQVAHSVDEIEFPVDAFLVAVQIHSLLFARNCSENVGVFDTGAWAPASRKTLTNDPAPAARSMTSTQARSPSFCWR